MPSYTLSRTGDAPLRIEGELFAESKGQLQAGREHQRWHDLAIYRQESRDQVGQLLPVGFAVVISYRTSWKGELGHDEVALVDNDLQVVRAFKRYDPCAHVRGFPDGQRYEERQKKLLADVRERYLVQVSEVLGHDMFAVTQA